MVHQKFEKGGVRAQKTQKRLQTADDVDGEAVFILLPEFPGLSEG